MALFWPTTLYRAFPPGEATPEQVHQIGCEFARRFLADRFECTVSTHLDKGHLHNHIVTNSVSFIDGKMFRNDFPPTIRVSAKPRMNSAGKTDSPSLKPTAKGKAMPIG